MKIIDTLSITVTDFIKSNYLASSKMIIGLFLILLGTLFVIFPEHLAAFLAGILMFAGIFFLYASRHTFKQSK